MATSCCDCVIDLALAALSVFAASILDPFSRFASVSDFPYEVPLANVDLLTAPALPHEFPREIVDQLPAPSQNPTDQRTPCA